MNRFVPLLLVLLVPAADLFAQAKPKDLVWTHAFDLACRKFGEADFSEKTNKFGIEGFYDPNNDDGLYIAQSGSVSLAKGFKATSAGKGPDWITGLDIPVRKLGEEKFTKTTKAISMEVFLDPNTDNFVYVTEAGQITSSPAKGKKGVGQQPVWKHAFDLPVRTGGEKEWDKAKKIPVEVYHDSGMNCLLFVTDSGFLAAVPHDGEIKEKTGPKHLHGIDLACRKAAEPGFTPSTKKWGVEVTYDATTNCLIYICETGSIAVAPATGKITAPTADVKDPLWTHGINIKCRAFGEKEFSDKTTVTGAEVFKDENTGVTVLVTEKGYITAVR